MHQKKNACSIQEWEHHINYILNTLKYHRTGKKEVANAFQKINFLQSVSLHQVSLTWWYLYYSLVKKQPTRKTHRSVCSMFLIVIYSEENIPKLSFQVPFHKGFQGPLPSPEQTHFIVRRNSGFYIEFPMSFT